MSHILSLPEEAGLTLRCAADAATVLRRPKAWPFLALVVAGELLVVLLLSVYPQGAIGRLLAPLLRALGGEFALDYPGAYAVFPRVVATIGPWLGLALTWPALALLLGATPRLLRDGSPRVSLSAARLPLALLAALPGCVIAGAVPAIHDRVGMLLVGWAGLGATLAVDIVGLLLLAVLGHAVPAVIFGRMGPFAALGASIAIAGRFPRLTAAGFLVEGAALALFRISPATVLPLFESVPPESMFPFLALGAVVSAVVLALRVLTFGRLYLHAYGESAT